MKIIKLLAYIIPFLMCLIFMGCSREGIEETREGEDTLVNLEIDVALSDVPVRMRNSEPASNENEKMKTLRIVVVRPDNTVESQPFAGTLIGCRDIRERFVQGGWQRDQTDLSFCQ